MVALFEVAAAQKDVGVIVFGEDALAEGEALAFVGACDKAGAVATRGRRGARVWV